jgi:uncharacterized protein YegP (UPF0339 family)
MRKAMGIMMLLALIVTLAAQTVTVTKPAVGETWVKGTAYAVTWTKSGTMPDLVRLSLRDPTTLAELKLIQDNVPNTGSYQWTVPAEIVDGQYRVRVKVKNVAISDDSEIFNIATTAPAGTISVKRPGSNEVWHLYSCNINGIIWSTTGNAPSPYTISLMSAAGTTVVATLPGTQICCSVGTSWPEATTEASPGSYRIRVKSSGSEVYGLSEVFSLSPDYVRITFPGTNGGVQETKNCTIS